MKKSAIVSLVCSALLLFGSSVPVFAVEISTQEDSTNSEELDPSKPIDPEPSTDPEEPSPTPSVPTTPDPEEIPNTDPTTPIVTKPEEPTKEVPTPPAPIAEEPKSEIIPPATSEPAPSSTEPSGGTSKKPTESLKSTVRAIDTSGTERTEATTSVTVYTDPSTETPESLTNQGGKTSSETEVDIRTWTANQPEDIDIKAGDSEYLLKWGDTLWAISVRSGIAIDTLASLNGIENVHLIYAGDVLKLVY